MWILALLLAQVPQGDPYGLYVSASSLPPGPMAVVAVAPAFPEDLVTGPQGEAVFLEVQVGDEGLDLERWVGMRWSSGPGM